MRASTVFLMVGLGFSLAPSCGGGGDPEPEPAFYLTCGDPACSGYGGPFDGVPLCADEGISAGDPCDEADLDVTCDPVDACNALVVCAEEDPTQGTGGCPISLKKYKREIAYLDAAARAKASEDLLAMKLATWRYDGALDDGAVHLGFLIDDVPGSPAVRADGGHVDLYGYTSLAVATIQEQQRRIDALEARLAALEAAR